MFHALSSRLFRGAAVAATLAACGAVLAQPAPSTPADTTVPGTSASGVVPDRAKSTQGKTETGQRQNKRDRRHNNKAVTEGASSAQTYDYPAPAPKSAPPKTQ